MTQQATLDAIRIDQAVLSDLKAAQAIIQAISACLEQSDTTTLQRVLDEHEAADIATVLELVSLNDAVALVDLIDDLGARGRIFGYLSPKRQIEIATSLDRNSLAAIVAAMPHDERADLFNRLTEAQREILLPGLALAEREDVRMLAAYGEGTIGVNRRPKRTPYRRAKGTPFVEQRDGYDGRFVRAGCGVGRA